MRLVCLWTAAFMISILTLSPAFAGDLTPPGAPAPTRGPEHRVEINTTNTPGTDTAFYRITSPGSYFLTGNIVNHFLFSEKNGIVVETSDVTIDLNGFVVDGFDAFIISPDTEPQGPVIINTTGILASGSLENITVRNGIVRDWTNDGVNVGIVRGGVVENVVVSDCGDTGIRAGSAFMVRDCASSDNGGNGFFVGPSSTVTNCTAQSNDGNGISVSFACTVRNCSLTFNGGVGIRASTDVLIVDCTATSSTSHGIRVEYQCVVNRCLVSNNDASGIYVVNEDNRIDSNNSTNNGTGITVIGVNNLIIRNSESDNDTSFGISNGNTVGPTIGAGDPITSTNPWANFSM